MTTATAATVTATTGTTGTAMTNPHDPDAHFNGHYEKVGYKVREHTLQRVPYLLVAGERERSEGTVSVRDVAGKDLGAMTPELVAALMQRMPASA